MGSSRPSSFTLTEAGPLRLYSTAELLTLPPPTWLIDGVLPEGSLSTLYAPPESFKSFVAIDLALCVATGRPWHGHAVRKGYVLYIAAEGGVGIGQRVRAWLMSTGVEPSETEIAWLPESLAVYEGSDDIAVFMKRIDEIERNYPSLIIIDTLARCFDGDENTQQDMGRFVAGLDQLRKHYGAAVLAVHHTRLDGARERGNTAFRAALDTMLMLKREGEDSPIVEMSCEKQKDAERFKDFTLELKEVSGSNSCVITTEGSEHLDAVLNTLVSAERPMKAGELEGVLVQSGLMSRPTLYRVLLILKKSRRIIKENGGYVIGNG